MRASERERERERARPFSPDAAELGDEQTRGPGTGRGDRVAEGIAHAIHKGLAGSERTRIAAGAGPGTLHPPDKLDATWNPQPWGEWKKR